LTQQGHQIIMTGLDKSFSSEPFNETTKTLLAVADYVKNEYMIVFEFSPEPYIVFVEEADQGVD
ncbi:16032_t:CDS:2, partial [Gigaspora margarita]